MTPSSRVFAQALLWLILGAVLLGCPGEDPDRQVFAQVCEDCHLMEFREAIDPVHVDVYPERCVACHGNAAWAPVDYTGHDEYMFPLISGSHAGLDCEECHPAPANTLDFTCTECHEHEKPDMDDEHGGIGGYEYVSESCLECHPRGSE